VSAGFLPGAGDLAGRTVRLSTREHTLYRGGQTTVFRLDDPLFEEEMRARFGPGVRIFVPGTFGTADFSPFRTNIRIDKAGSVTAVYNG